MIPLDTIQLETFSPLVGCGFVTGDVRLELIAVNPLGHKRTEAARDPFALKLRGPQGLRLGQGIYRFECEGLGGIEFFITQVGDGSQGSEFEAIFT